MELEFLDFSGLTLYDSLIKEYIDEGDANVASSITSQEERIQGIEEGLSGLRKVTNSTRGAVENIQATLDDGVALIEKLSGQAYTIAEIPVSGETGHKSLMTASGSYKAVTSKGRYFELNESGTTEDSVINVSIPNYTELDDTGALILLKTKGTLDTAMYTFLQIEGYEFDSLGQKSAIFNSGKRRLYFNGRYANEINSWDSDETIIVWTDGESYFSMPAKSYTNVNQFRLSGGTTLGEWMTSTDNKITTLSANTKNAIDDLSGKTNTAINNLSAATNTAISNLSSATSNAISALSSATHSELERVEGKVDVNSAAINALSLGAKTTTSVSPGCIYKGEAANVTVTATFTPNDLKPSEIYLREDSASGTILASGTNVNTVSKVQSYTLNANSKNFVSTAKYEGAQFMHSAALQARYPIYCGFCNTNGTTPVYADITNTSHRLSARTSAAGKYTATATGANQKYCILVPSDIGALSTFTMGGAPVDMVSTTTTVGTVEYKAYYTNALYIAGGYVDITAS